MINMRKGDNCKIGKKAIAVIVIFAMVFSVLVGMNAWNGSAGNADKGIKSPVDVTAGTTPTINGVLAAGEWADAVNVSLTKEGTEYAKAYLKHDGTKLYIGFDIKIEQDDNSNVDELQVYIDKNHNHGAAPQTDDYKFYTTRDTHTTDADEGYWYNGTGTGWTSVGIELPPGWSGKSNTTSTAWYVEYKVEYTALGITAGSAKTIGIGFKVNDALATPGVGYKTCSWPEALVYNDPGTWGDASSSDSWLKVPVGWLEGYTKNATGTLVGSMIWLYGGAGKYYNTSSNGITGYYNFNNTVPKGIPVGDYSLVAMGENLTSGTQYATIQEEVTTKLNITLSANPPTEDTKTAKFKDEFANLTSKYRATWSTALVSIEQMIPGINTDGYINDTEAGLAEAFFAVMLPPEPVAGNPMSDILIDDTPYLYVAGTWNATVDVPAGNVTKIVDITWTIKANGTATVNVSKTEHIINMTVDFDTETYVSSGEYILPQGWRMNVYDASTLNVTITGWTTITVDPQIDSNLKDAITNETVSITVVKDTSAPAKIAGFAAVPGLTSAALTWTAAPEPDFKEYRIYKSTSAITDVTGLTPIKTITDKTVITYAAETLHGNWYFAIVAVDAVGNVGILNATGPILMNQAPVANFTILPVVGPYYTGTVITFNASTSTDPDAADIATLNYTWNVSPGPDVKKYGLEVDYTFTAIGTFDVTLTVKDTYAANNSKTLPITLAIPNLPPVANFTISAAPYYRSTVITFTSTSTDPDGVADIVNCTWNISGVIKYGPVVNHTFTALGIFNVTLTVRDSYGETDPITKQITIVNRAPTASFTTSATEAEVGVEITFTSTSTDPESDTLTYLWTFGDNTTSIEANPKHAYTSAGTYTVTLKVTDAYSATHTSTATTITIKEKPGIADIWLYGGIGIVGIVIIIAIALVVAKKKKKPEVPT